MASASALTRAIESLTHSRVRMRRVLLATLAALLALSLAAVLSFGETASQVDRREHAAQQQRALSYLSNESVVAGNKMEIQLVWSDTYDAIGSSVDRTWADVYIGQFFAHSLGFDASLIVSPQGRVLRGWRAGRSDAGLTDRRPDWLGPMLQKAEFEGVGTEQRDLIGRRWSYGKGGIPLMRQGHSMIEWNGAPAIATLAAILPDSDHARMKAEPNYVVAIRQISPAFLRQMTSALALDRAWHSRTPEYGPAVNSVALRDLAGHKLGWLNWPTRPFTAALRDGMAPLFAVFLIFLTCLVIGAALIVGTLMRAMTALEEEEARARHNSQHDTMSGLANRGHFLDQLRQDMATLDPRAPDQQIALAYFDLDHFKVINDTIGHHAGDDLICAMADRLRKGLRTDDCIARIGGDEFAVIRKLHGSDDNPENLGAQVLQLTALPFQIANQTLTVSVSCGIAWTPDHGTGASQLLHHADVAMYQAKRAGRGQWQTFNEKLAARALRQRDLAQELQIALAEKAFEVAYQPIVDVASGRPVGVEALLRWNHPEIGPIRPAEFIRVAEECGQMSNLGWWMIRQAFTDHARFPDLPLSINLSPAQIGDPQFIGRLESLVSECRVATGLIVFEVTEATLQRVSGRGEVVLEWLQAMGFKLALDDFGTGPSGIAQLRRLGFNQIKIDRGFVLDLAVDVEALAMFRSIVELGGALGIQVIAEGVETGAQRQLVLSAGCRHAQGRLFWDALSCEQIAGLSLKKPAKRAKIRAA